jgi:hypothetical protein
MPRGTRPGSGIGSRYRALLMTHRSLEEKLQAEMRRPLPDAALVRRIKRRKLLVKDELAAIDRLLCFMHTSQADAASAQGHGQPRKAAQGARSAAKAAAYSRDPASPAPAADARI